MALRLADAGMSTTGVAMHTYVPAGEVRTGSFAAQEPSAAEIGRRKRIAAEG